MGSSCKEEGLTLRQHSFCNTRKGAELDAGVHDAKMTKLRITKNKPSQRERPMNEHMIYKPQYELAITTETNTKLKEHECSP